MKSFVMSMFATKEDLYKAKAKYWESVANRCIDRLLDTEDLYSLGNEDYLWGPSGEELDEGL